MSWSIVAAFLLSGFAGLMHEIVWSHLLAALIGTTAHAQAAVLVVYMGGLALGSLLFGRRGDSAGRPLRTYALLEVAIALYSLLLPVLFAATGAAYVALASRVFESSSLKLGLRFAMALLTVLLPAVLMGGTLPLLARSVIRDLRNARRQLAVLYAANNFGAVFGAATAGFVTLPLLGVFPSLFLAAALNVAAAALVWPLARREARLASEPAPAIAAAPPPSYPPRAYTVTLFALVLSGFAAMGYEVVFIRVITLAFGATTYSFTAMLMSFVTGIGLGSLLTTALPTRRPLWLLGATQLVVAAAFVAATPLLERFPYYVGLLRIAAPKTASGFFSYELAKALLCLAVLLVPTVCMGIAFPLVAAVQARHPRQVGSHVGSTYACNTLGNVLGVLVTTLVLFPSVGLLGAFHVNLALTMLAAVLVLAVAEEAVPLRRVVAVGAAAAVVALYAGAGTRWVEPLLYSLNHLTMREGPAADASAEERAEHPTASFANWKRHYVIDRDAAQSFHLEEEAHASVLVARFLGETVLAVNTKGDASTASADLETQLLLAHTPLFMQPRARNLLVIGYGSGITLGSALRHPVDRADVVEISRGVLEADAAFIPYNYNAQNDPRVHVYLDDAQSFLNTVPRQYDVIISEPSNPWIAGIAGLFTVEFFADARAKLAPGGVFAVWFHEYDQSDEAIALILRTLAAEFPDVMLFHEQSYGDVIAIASLRPVEVDFAVLEDRFDEPAVRNDLSRIGIVNLASLLSHQAVSAARVPALLGSGPVNHIYFQRLEYEALRAMFLGQFSELVPRANPLLDASLTDSDSLLDRYIHFRAGVGEPLRREELGEAALHMSTLGKYAADIQRSLLARAERLPAASAPAQRPARGAIPEPATAGALESLHWARRFTTADDLERAIAFERRALELNPDDVDTGARLSDLLAAADDLPAAVTLIDALLERHPGDPKMIAQRGWLSIREGQFAAARARLGELLAQRDSPAVRGMIAHLLFLEGDDDQARSLLAAAAAADRGAVAPPRLWQVSALMAQIVAQRGDRAAALAIVERTLETSPKQPQLLALRDAWENAAP